MIARIPVSPPAILWVVASNRRFGIRSASTPPGKPSINVGPNWHTLMRPSWNADPVIVSTSHDWASVCIQVPVKEPSWANQKIR